MIGTHRHAYKKAAPGEFFKFCKCGKRKKAGKTERQVKKGLMRKAEDLWRAIAHKRDGYGCQIQKVFPELNLSHNDVMQVDHFFPRGDKNLFFEPSNATVLCAICNYLRSAGATQSTILNIALKDIVLRREGQTKFDEMFQLNNSRPPNREWGRVPYLTETIKKLEDVLSGLQS